MARDSGFTEVMIRSYEERAADPKCQWRIHEMVEFAPGVVLTRDQEEEVTIFFDTKRWAFSDPDLWERAPGFTRPRLDALFIDILPNIGVFPPIAQCYLHGMPYVKRHLRPVDPTVSVWNPEPVFVTIPESIRAL